MSSNNKKDYYKILGVQEDADELVIRAAYQALLKRYNLDDWKGDKQQAIRILADINEAYSILRDRYERLEYNASKVEQQQEAIEPIQVDMTVEELDAAWLVACNYYEDLDVLHWNLFQISEEAASNFKLSILGTKDFSNRNKLAAKFELDFLRNQFGNDQDLIYFGRELILEDAKDAAAELHQVVNIMGNSVHSEEIIHKISKKYQTQRYLNELQKVRQQEIEQENERLKKIKAAEEKRKRLLREENEAREGRKKVKKFFLICVIICVSAFIFSYWYASSVGLPTKHQQTSNQSLKKTDANSSCNKYLDLRINAIKVINKENAEKYAYEYENCSGLKLSQPINVEELFAEEDSFIRSMGDELYFFPSGASVNKRAAYSINLGWKILLIEENIPTFNSRHNLEKAYDLMQYAYNKGHPEAASNIGYMFEYGLGFSKNISKAVYWYKKAIDMGEPHSPQAEYQLAKIYQSGEDGYQKITEAKELYFRVIEKTQSKDYANLSKKYRELAQTALSEIK